MTKHPRKISIYRKFWTELKKRKALIVKVPPELIETFVRGLKKQKDRDRTVKALNAIDPLKLVITRQPHHPNGSRLVLLLKQQVGLSDIMLPDETDIKLAEISIEDI